MYPRIKIAEALIRLGRFIQALPVVVMRPDDLVELNRRYYRTPHIIQEWCNYDRVENGLSELERSLLDKAGIRSGKILLLGLGGGREAIPLAQMGFEVTGIDFVPQMAESAKENARKAGVEITAMVQELSRLDQPCESFDMAWLSAGMYSCVPTRKRRVQLLKRIRATLRTGGIFLFGFFWNPREQASLKAFYLKKLLAGLTLGNFRYESGDMLLLNKEFIHGFSSTDHLQSEFLESGLELLETKIVDEFAFAGGIARRSD